MFSNKITQTYNHLDATMEILILLTGAFLLGLLTCWLLYKLKKNDPLLANHIDDSKQTKTNTNHEARVIDSVSSIDSIGTEDQKINHQPSKVKTSSLSKIRGLNKPIEKYFNTLGISSYEDLKNIKKENFERIIKAKELSHIHKNELKTWPHQAALATKKDWKKLSEYQYYIENSIISTGGNNNHNETTQSDNLQKIKGINAEIEEILNKKGIYTYKQLRKADASALKKYITEANPNFKKNQTATWSHQASIAEKKKWKELNIYQEFMDDININTENLSPSKDKKVTTSTIVLQTNSSSNKSFTDSNIKSQRQFEKNTSEKQEEKEKNKFINSVENKKTTVIHDDFKKIEGIDSKIEAILNKNNIYTYSELHKYNLASLNEILNKSGKDNKNHDFKSWLHQAGMAAREEWNELRSYQNIIRKNSNQATFETLPDNQKKKQRDDLKKINGIGPKIEELLNKANILTYEDLKIQDRNSIKLLLDKAGSQFKMHEPATWPIQAELAQKNEWDKLKEFQSFER